MTLKLILSKERRLVNDQLHSAFEHAKRTSEKNLQKLNEISRDIKELESFLKKSAFEIFGKIYEVNGVKFEILWDGKRLIKDHRPLIETKYQERLLAYPVLSDFLQSITEKNKHESFAEKYRT